MFSLPVPFAAAASPGAANDDGDDEGATNDDGNVDRGRSGGGSHRASPGASHADGDYEDSWHVRVRLGQLAGRGWCFPPSQTTSG